MPKTYIYNCSWFCLILLSAAAAAKSFQSCPTLCDPIDGSPPGSAVPGILQARTLEWVAISFSNAWKWKVKGKSLSRVWLFVTPWTAAHQAPPSMGFSRQEYWSGLPLPSSNLSWLHPYYINWLLCLLIYWHKQMKESGSRFRFKFMRNLTVTLGKSVFFWGNWEL